MFFSLLWLKTSYSSRHYIAAGCIIAGVVVVVLPSFSRHVVTAMVGFEILLFSGNIPGALSSVYKQASLQYKVRLLPSRATRHRGVARLTHSCW